MRIAITGGTGFLGRALIPRLVSRGDTITVLTRDPARARGGLPSGVEALAWDARGASGPWRDAVVAADAVLSLAGEPVMTQRWNEAAKQRILDSRVNGTRALVDALATSPRPRVFVSASGVDYYGDTGEREVDESAPAGDTFLARVCVAWEREAARAAEFGAREVRLRTGVVLGESGGALSQMITPFKLFVGGPIGTGRQWFPWVHLEDALRAMEFVLDRASISGPVNMVGPSASRMRDVSRALGKALKRPSWAPVPQFALRLAVGEAADMLVESKRVRPGVLLREGFVFRHAELGEAMQSAVGAGA